MAAKSPAAREAPVCFGDRYREDDPKCERCEVQAACARLTAKWAERTSLAEQLASVERTLDDERIDESVEETYTRLYCEFFGRKPRHGASVQHERGFAAVRALPPEIDRETYIAGNMWAMESFARNSRYGFLPLMLSGEKALRRYHAYLGKIGRRYRHGKHTAKNTHTERGRFRRQLFEAEHEIAEWFVSGRVAGRTETWDAATRYVRPNEVWTAAHGQGPSSIYHRLCSTFGTQAIEREVMYATLRAAVSIAEQYAHRLAERIGVRTFEWDAFADLIARTVQLREASAEPALAGLDGRAWRW